MEEDKHDHLGNVVRPPSLRIAKSFKGNLSGRQGTPRGGHSPSPFRRSPSLKTPKRDVRLYKRTAQWIRGSRLLTLMCLVAIWGYIGFHFQSSWAHSRIEEEFDGFKVSEHENSDETPELPKEYALDRTEVHDNALHSGKAISNSSLSKSENSRARSMGEVRVRRACRRSWRRRSKAAMAEINADQFNEDRDAIKHNASLGKLVGPFDMTDSRFLGNHVVKKHATCDRNGHFANFVLGKSFVVVLHEVSMTGAPLAMMELATEILGCGGKVSAITLSRRGGLLQEFTARGIPVLKDKTTPSFKVASKTDLIIVGSAVGASWIEQYLSHYKRGINQLVWWIMENRRLYFDRSKHMLQNVKAVLFLSELQSQRWRMWCAEEGIKLPPLVDIVPLSVSDELVFVAGLQTSLNGELVGENNMLEKKNILRAEVRRLMGLDPDDMLVMSLSSINPGKGQLSLLKAALMTLNETFALDMMNFTDETIIKNDSLSTTKIDTQFQISDASRSSREILGKLYSKRWFSSNKHTNRKLASNEAAKNQTLKLLIGSVGSKSNKVRYVKAMFSLISEHPELASRILWTPSTVHVAPLYAAADVYVINAQGIGETFGRVTIEAMAFGLPILGTDAGGTKEIVDGNVTGLLHPIGQPGIKVLSDNLRFLQDNKAARKEMGQKGKEKVTKLYLKHQMYENFARILKLATNHN